MSTPSDVATVFVVIVAVVAGAGMWKPKQATRAELEKLKQRAKR